MSAALRAGVVGLGQMGRHHARVLRELDGVELVGAADPDAARGAVLSGQPLVPDLAALIALGLDFCVVAVPTGGHLEAGLALAAAGIPTLVEKPLAADLASGEALVAAFDAAGVLGCVGFVERYNPSIRALHAHLAGGELGEVFQIATRRQGPFPDRIADVGVVKDLATHDLDLTSWVAGSPYRSVAARTAHRAGRPHEDLVAAVGQLADGTVTSHLVNWLTPTKERKIVVTGERGMYEADTLTADLTYFRNAEVPTEWDAISRFRGVSEGDVVRYAIAKPEPLRVELAHFRDAVLGVSDADVVPMRDALRTLAVADAVLESARTASVVELPA